MFIWTVIFVYLLQWNAANGNNFKNNTFKLNGMFSIQTPDGINYQTGAVMAEAFRFAIQHVNKLNPDFLHGYRLQLNDVLDVHDGDTKEITSAVKMTILRDIPFLVGPFSSETSYVTRILSGIFNQFVVSYGATYCDFDEVAGLHSRQLRTVPSNSFRIQALYSVMKEFRWNYINIITSYGYDGERDIRHFTKDLQKLNICVGSVRALPHYAARFNYMDVLKAIANDQRANVLLLYTNVKDSKNLIKAISENGYTGRFKLFCALGCTSYKEVTEGFETVAEGMLDLDLHIEENKNFEQHFLSQNPQNNQRKYFIDLWENHFNCSLNQNIAVRNGRSVCRGDERFEKGGIIYKNTPVQTVVNAVYAIASAVRTLIQKHCGWKTKDGSLSCYLDASKRSLYNGEVFKILLNSTFKDGTVDISKALQNSNYSGNGFFKSRNESHMLVRYDLHYYGRDTSGKYRNLQLGHWSIKRESSSFNLRRKMNSNIPKLRFFPTYKKLIDNITGISCSLPCPPGHYRSPDSSIVKAACCWSCSPCPKHHISVNESCMQCAVTEHARNNKCEMLPQRYLRFGGNLSAVVFTILSLGGFISVGAVASIFIWFNDHKVVRASGRDLFYIMLLGTFLTFVCPFTMLAKPSGLTCMSRGILPGLAFLTCYAPLFLKTNRIHRIFINGKKSATPPTLVSPQSQLFILAAITSIQILLSSVWFVSKSPEPILVVSPDRSHTVLKCKGDASPILILLNLAMSVMFMICCTVLAFKTRRFPKNFNEAKDIGVTLYVTCVVWSVFLPAYFLVLPWSIEFIREYLMSSVSIVIGYTSLFGLFGRKLKILLTSSKDIPLKRKCAGMPDRKKKYNFVSSIKVSKSLRGNMCSKIVESPNASIRMIQNGKHDVSQNNNDIETCHQSCTEEE